MQRCYLPSKIKSLSINETSVCVCWASTYITKKCNFVFWYINIYRTKRKATQLLRLCDISETFLDFVFYFFLLLSWPRYKRRDILHIKFVILSIERIGDRYVIVTRGLSMRLCGSLINSRSPGRPSLDNPSAHTLVAKISLIFLVHMLSWMLRRKISCWQ